VACCRPAVAAPPDAAATVVVYNRNDPDSKSLATYYAGKRGIPNDQVVGLDCAPAEEITRGDYNATIADPLRSLFAKRQWWKTGTDATGRPAVVDTKIRYVALMRGMPLKIAPDPTIPPANFVPGLPPEIANRNEASVDSELATLGITVPSVSGIVPNPYFNRFTPVRDGAIPAGYLLVARLDGPTPIIVRAMIDDALLAEREGLWGWAYVDARNITSGGYAEGDNWLRNSVSLMRNQGVPVIFDNTPPTFPVGYPVTDAALYYGWYAGDACGPFADPAFSFERGAVAVHIHSFSASTLRSATSNWCGPLLVRGAAATLGNVYEPYLALTAQLDVFQDRLMSGFNLAESAYISQRVLSWMGVVIGDPLYRPFLAWSSVQSDPSNAWQVYRRIVKTSGGNTFSAAPALVAEGTRSSRSVFLEGPAAAQYDAADFASALTNFQSARKLATTDPVRLRLDLEIIATLRQLGRADEADRLAAEGRQAFPPGPQRDLFGPDPNAPLPVVATPSPEAVPSAPAPALAPTPVPSPIATPEPTPTPTPLPTPGIPDLPP
jgi:uncharacterized protein (TIGR03790 family)